MPSTFKPPGKNCQTTVRQNDHFTLVILVLFTYNSLIMELNFYSNPGQRPRPRHEVHLTGLTVTPYSDGQRLRVQIEITPFSPADRPSLNILINDPTGNEISSIDIVETLQPNPAITLHLKANNIPVGLYTVIAHLLYEETVQHSLETSVTFPDDIPDS